MLEKCPECKAPPTSVVERVELIDEPFEGKLLTYGSRFSYCTRCKVTWYGRTQMQEQLRNRGGCL